MSVVPQVEMLTPSRQAIDMELPGPPTGKFYDVGQAMLMNMFERCLTAYPPEWKEALLQYLNSKGASITANTYCSGTECPMLVLHAFAQAASNVWSIKLDVVHKSSTEKDAGKQKFITKYFGSDLGALFKDTCVLRETNANNILTDTPVPVPKALVHFYGFPCDDVSSKNIHRMHNMETIKNADNRTGTVFNDIMLYYETHDSDELSDETSDVSISENVPALANRKDPESPSNLDWACAKFREQAKLLPVVFNMNPKLQLWEVNRPRIYFVLLKMVKIVGFNESLIRTTASQVMNLAHGISTPVTIDSLRLCDDDQLITDHNSSLKNKFANILDTYTEVNSDDVEQYLQSLTPAVPTTKTHQPIQPDASVPPEGEKNLEDNKLGNEFAEKETPSEDTHESTASDNAHKGQKRSSSDLNIEEPRGKAKAKAKTKAKGKAKTKAAPKEKKTKSTGKATQSTTATSSDSHPARNTEADTNKTITSSKVTTGGRKWLDDHQEATGSSWATRVGPSVDQLKQYPGLLELTDREMDKIVCKNLPIPSPEILCMDLSPSWKMTNVGHKSCYTVIPTMRLYFGDKCRVGRGLEAMQFQGLHYGSQHKLLREESDRELGDLAGNAFHAWSCAAAWLTGVTTLSILLMRKSKAGTDPLASALITIMDEDSDDEMDDLLGY